MYLDLFRSPQTISYLFDKLSIYRKNRHKHHGPTLRRSVCAYFSEPISNEKMETYFFVSNGSIHMV